jgi:hypothetical protein
MDLVIEYLLMGAIVICIVGIVACLTDLID